MERKIKKKKIQWSQIVLHCIFIALCACYVLPFMMVITVSLSNSQNILNDGLNFFPKEIDFTAYKIIFEDLDKIIQAYKVTIEFSLLHTILAVIVQALVSYPMSKSYFRGRKFLTWFVFVTMLFGAGMIPTYLIYSKYYHLSNNFWVYVIPGLVSAWNCMIIRTFYNGVPTSLYEAARIDGAGEFRTFLSIAVPMAKPCYASVGFLTLVGKWNDWNTTMVYIRDSKLYSLQYLLQTMLRDAEQLKKMMEENPSMAAMMENNAVSTEPMRFAMALIAAGPVLLIFPWFQRYFAQGMTVGAVKG